MAPPYEGRRFDRCLGRYTTGRPGPTVLVTGGLHGNEPAGAIAAEHVLAQLRRETVPLRGEVVAVAGNLRALSLNRRFVERDLNRCWLPERVAELRAGTDPRPGAEDAEQRALLEVIHDAVGRAAPEPIIALDLHTTSGRSPPFTLMSDTLRNRRIAFAWPGTVILGLEESVDGTLIEHLTESGHIAVVVEAGQHEDPGSVALHEAVIWLGLVAAGALRREDLPGGDVWRRRMAQASRGLPRVVEVRYRHAIRHGDGFRMRPGYLGLQPVRRGEVLAEDRAGEIRAPEAGRILMPLYQEQGNDGFFVVRRVSRIWLGLSAFLRRLKLQWLLLLLPGVRRDPDRPRSLRVDPRVARWFVVEVFHLFGFRRHRARDGYLYFSRRRPV